MRNDPFSKLGALDQRLYKNDADRNRGNERTPASEPSPAPAQPPSPQETSHEVGKEGSRERGKEVGRLASPEPERKPFDLNVKPYRKDSYLFTDDEFEALEDLKIELRRKYDLKTTKNDLARCAIGTLVRDFQKRGETSTVVVLLKTRK